MTDVPKIKETARILDTLEARHRPSSGSAVDLVGQVVCEQALPYTAADIHAASQGHSPLPAAPPASEGRTRPRPRPLPIGRLAVIAAGVSLGVGGLVDMISQVFYAAFMATICTWVGSCFLLNQVRDWVEKSPQ